VSRVLLIVLIAACSFSSYGQLLDDTTKLVYGPTTSRYMYERDLMHSDTLYQSIDTSIYNLEYFEFKNTAEHEYHDLGNNGTALNHVYYVMPTSIGRTTGFESYTPYVKKIDEQKYFDTKSPFIDLYVGIGGKGRSLVDFQFSRNINAQWNVGFDIKKLSSNKLIGSASLREPQVSSTSADIYTFYSSKDSKYHFMFHTFHIDHGVAESGGIVLDDTSTEKDYFQYQNSQVYLDDAKSFDTRNRLHIYHQYSIKPFFELYNSITRNNVENRYEDPALLSAKDFYDQTLIDSVATNDASLFTEWEVEAGVKGRIAQRVFYSGFVKRRDLNFTYAYLSPYDRVSENYLGGDLKIYITPENALIGAMEVSDGGQYYFRGAFENNFIKAAYTGKKYRPSFLSERYFGNHYEWNNSFDDIVSNSLEGSIFYDFKFLYLAPSVQITSINNYVFFGTDKTPEQNEEVAIINKYSVDANFLLGHFHIENRLIFNNVSGGGAGAIRSPDWNYFGKWYYENIVFNDFMQFQIGLDIKWQTAYFVDAYDPITQQFHIQDDFKVDAFWTSDLFFVMRARRLSVWMKLKYVNQKRDDGYFETPLYPGTRKMFDVGVKWHFYD
jgi:hypothetical protein